MHREASDRSWVSILLSVRICEAWSQETFLIRSGTKPRITAVVGREVSPGEIPVALRAPSISPGLVISFWYRRRHPHFALTTEQKKLDRREKQM